MAGHTTLTPAGVKSGRAAPAGATVAMEDDEVPVERSRAALAPAAASREARILLHVTWAPTFCDVIISSSL
jgi:hypothetical protein